MVGLLRRAGESEGHEQQVDGFDADERNDETAEPVDDEVAAEKREAASGR